MVPYCEITLNGPVATIEFGTPAHNALPSSVLKQLVDHLHQIKLNLSIKLVIIKSQGNRSFCAGADLTELIRLKDDKSAKDFFLQFARVILAIRSLPQLVITRVQGKSVGGAIGLIAGSDLVYATTHASVRLSELINGIGPFVVGPSIERKIGLSAFNHMAFNPGTWFDANWALGHGLYNEIFQDNETMDQRIESKTNELLTYSSSAISEIKSMMWAGTPDWEELLDQRAATSGRLLMTPESKKALEKLMDT